MKALDTFRFTSKDREALCQIADCYGGKVGEWTPHRSKEQQWEVVSESSEIRVFLPQNSIDVWYEEWSGGGLVRRCDGLNAQVEIQTPDGTDIDMIPCHCSQQIELNRPMTCDPHTRLNVILPDIRFGGTWRLESKGWNAAKELPAMGEVITQMQSMGIVEGVLSLEKRTKKSGGQTRNFVVPKLSTNTSPLDIMQGKATPTIDTIDEPLVLEEHVGGTLEGFQTEMAALREDAKEVIEAEIVEGAELWDPEAEEVKGWDVPPEGVQAKKNPEPPPKWLPA
tara:strand:- start:6066 stop:6908 length:843 start_codon:yes stop_codon:yes gene_type:complete